MSRWGMPPRTPRRTEALSRERIVEAAVELLDANGESGLTFRTLTERLATGAGAIYWHVANKGELLDAATDGVLADALKAGSPGSPHAEVRAVAIGLVAAIDRPPGLPSIRTEFLDTGASAWEELDPEEYPCTLSVAAELRGHDDREQFLA